MLAETEFSPDAIEPSSPTIDRGLDFSNSPIHRDTDQTTKTNSSHRNNNVISDSASKKLQIHRAGKSRSSDRDSNSSTGSNSSKRKSEEGFELVDDYYSKDNTINTQSERKVRSDSSSAGDVLQQQVVLPTDSDMLTGVTTYQAVQVSVLRQNMLSMVCSFLNSFMLRIVNSTLSYLKTEWQFS